MTLTFTETPGTELVPAKGGLSAALVKIGHAVDRVAHKMGKVKGVSLTDEQKIALRTLTTAAPLVVSEPRLLSQVELDQLAEERKLLDTAVAYIDKRKADMKEMLYNHWDTAVIASQADAEVDGKGRFVTAEETEVLDGSRRWVRQISSSSPSVSAAALDEIATSGTVEGFSHQEYLLCTREQRVLDEGKTLMMMTRKPEVMTAALRAAMTPGSKSSSLYFR